MSKRCPECHAVNEDSRVFCSSCGSPLDAELRLIQDLEKQKATLSKPKPAPTVKHDDDDDYIPPKTVNEPKSAMPWILLGLLVVAAAVAYFMLK